MQLLKDSLGWGVALWLIGYLLGIALFTVVPADLIGWIILPIGVALTMWVLTRRIHAQSLGYYLVLSLSWTAIAVACDYLFIVRAFAPADGYYKPDVYLYYALSFLLPLGVGIFKSRHPYTVQPSGHVAT